MLRHNWCIPECWYIQRCNHGTWRYLGRVNGQGTPVIVQKICHYKLERKTTKTHRELYGIISIALLLHKKPVTDRVDYGFETNEYYPCVANNTVNGSQMKVFWYVDDLKVSHKDKFEITRFATYLNDIYGWLWASHGKVHNYLGMTLDYSDKGKLQVLMIPYLINIIKDFPEDIGEPADTPATDHLFKVRPEGEEIFLPEEKAQVFNNTVAHMMFLSARSQRDIQTAVALLTTRVKKPEKDYCFKLRWCLK